MAADPRTPPSVERLSTPPGLCSHCRHARLIASSRSTFLRCARAELEPEFPRYPPLPVLRCAGYEPVTSEDIVADT